MVVCGMKGCGNKPCSKRNVPLDVSFHRMPKIILNQGDETKKLTEERRRLWKAAVYRKDITTEEKWNKLLICSKHFVGGKPAYVNFRNNPSWVPTLHLGHERSSTCSEAETSKNRYLRLVSRKRDNASVPTVHTASKKQKSKSSETSQEEKLCDRDFGCSSSCEESVHQDSEHVGIEDSCSNDQNTQTDLTGQNIDAIMQDCETRLLDSVKNRQRCSIYERQVYVEDEAKVPFYTGLPSLAVMDLIFRMVEPYMSNQTKSLSKEQEFLLCLIKIRLNYQFQDIGYQLKVSVSTVQRSFHRTLDVLVARLSFLLHWPSREALKLSMPMCFRENFKDKVAVIVDSFELEAQKPLGQSNQIQVYSNYKKYSAKYLIGITPQGSIIYISDAFVGRASDKHIIENTSLLFNLLPGDIIMADRGFNIEDEVLFYQAKLIIPEFTHGKKQLYPLQVENSRKIASVRIHVERVIGFVRRKFGILQSKVPIDLMATKPGDDNPVIDKIVRLCCCIVNLHKSLVPIE